MPSMPMQSPMSMPPQQGASDSNALLQMLSGGMGGGAMDPMALMGIGSVQQRTMPPQMPPGLEGLSPEQVQMLLMMLQQQGMPSPTLQGMAGQPGQQGPGMQSAYAGDMLSPTPGSAAMGMQSY